MEYLAASMAGGVIVALAGLWGWRAGQEAHPPRPVPGPMRLVHPVRRPAPPPSAAKQALDRLEAVVAAHRARALAGDQNGMGSPRQS